MRAPSLVTGAAVVLGLVLAGWLFWSSPQVDFDGPGEQEAVTLACVPLGRDDPKFLGTSRDPEDVLTGDQAAYAQDYADEESPAFEGLEANQAARAEVASGVFAICGEARTRRQTVLGLVTTATGVLAIICYLQVRGRPRPTPPRTSAGSAGTPPPDAAS